MPTVTTAAWRMPNEISPDSILTSGFAPFNQHLNPTINQLRSELLDGGRRGETPVIEKCLPYRVLDTRIDMPTRDLAHAAVQMSPLEKSIARPVGIDRFTPQAPAHKIYSIYLNRP
jgi:hypothetical protein